MTKHLVHGLLAAALLMTSCSKEKIFVQLPGTVWTITSGDVTTWLCFHDADSASILQLKQSTGRTQIDHGTYVTDGHEITVSTEFASDYKVNRTFFTLKRATSNDSFDECSPYSYSTLAGSVWASPVSNDYHIAYFPSEDQCVDIVYTNITRSDGGAAYGWGCHMNSVSVDGHSVKAGGAEATLYKGIMLSGTRAALCMDMPAEETGTSALKGTVWVYNNTGSPADVPCIVIFNGKESFVRISGAWAGSVSSVRVNPIVFDITHGTYSGSDGDLTLTFGDDKESCPVSGGSFTLYEKTYRKLDY